MIEFLQVAFVALGLICFLIGLHTLAYFPLAAWFELRKRRPAPSLYREREPLVSIVVPAYNEGKVIAHCVASILDCDYPNKEVILVDDGSRDDTLAHMRRFAGHPNVRVVAKANGGKASALNAGLRQAHGEVIFFVDADGVFARDTIRRMLDAFDHPGVGAVCGSDAPVNLDRLQTHLACLQTHVSTGFVRRALAVVDCMPVISGNIGAFRRDVLQRTGPFLEGFVGEDLELTWRVHRAGYRVNFAPDALVYAEVPSTIGGLWKQRVRWSRGLLQTAWLHRRMFFNSRYGSFGWYLPMNFAAMVLVPVLQLVTLALLIPLAAAGHSPVALDVLPMIGWLGLGMTLAASVFAIALDRAWQDLRYLYALPLWVPYSVLISAAMTWAIALELFGAKAHWNKLERTGVISRRQEVC